jgi:small-conductance mechanosensitive channel
MDVFGIRLVGLNPENGRKLLLSVALIVGVVVAHRILRVATDAALRADRLRRARFWVRQVWRLVATVFVVVGLVSLWFDDPSRLATFFGLITAGLAFALQKVVTAIAGYIVLVRGKIFSVGDRIVMGGVRGDVIDMTLTETQIMEMGQPPGVEQQTDPAMWVHARQYTGRIVSVSNARIFDEPVYNYTREFPYIWEEIRLPVSYTADRAYVEQLLLDVARRHTADIQRISDDDRRELQRRYFLETPDLEPRVFWRITDNWLELAVRFIANEHGVRGLKDKMSRDILAGLDARGIGIASATFEITGLPALELAVDHEKHEKIRPRARTSGG